MSKRDFNIGITHIRRDPGSILRFNMMGQIDDLKVVASRVDSRQAIEVEGVLEAVHGGILVTGIIHTSWIGECRRCLGTAGGDLDISVRELFERMDNTQAEAEEGDTYPYFGDVIDLREMVKDQILLELPLAPICNQDCKGLCPICGTDLNTEACDCSNSIKDPRWNVLDALIPKDG